MEGDSLVVPTRASTIDEIFRFALTFNGYERLGGFEPVGELANDVSEAWHTNGDFPDDVDALRTALFFEQRRWRHFGYPPDEAADRYLRALVDQLHAVSGGRVEAPADPLP